MFEAIVNSQKKLAFLAHWENPRAAAPILLSGASGGVFLILDLDPPAGLLARGLGRRRRGHAEFLQQLPGQVSLRQGKRRRGRARLSLSISFC